MGSIKTNFSFPLWARVYIDTNAFIYFIEQNNEYFQIIAPIFDMVWTGHISAFTSGFTLTELLVKPLRDRRHDIVQAYRDLLLDPELITLGNTTIDTYILAADIAAVTMMKTPDALHMGTAIENNCTFFITNDKKITSQKKISVLYVSELR